MNFIFNHILAKYPMLDPKIGLTAVVKNITPIHFGTIDTPIVHLRP